MESVFLGTTGRQLRINLSSGRVSSEEVDESILKDYIGGVGYGARLLYDELAQGVDPLGPENKILFLTSPLTVNKVPGGGSIEICFKSPATNGWGEARCGGNFGPDLKRAGFDHIIIEGKSESPVYLEVVDGSAILKDASHLSGKSVYEKCSRMEKDASMPAGSRYSSMCIGVAGENQVLFASIMFNDRAAGRGGGGAVMGSKNLLGIVVGGTGKIEPKNKELFQAAVKESFAVLKSNPMTNGFRECGTVGDMPANDEEGDWPSMNWRSNSWGKGTEIFDHFQEKNLVKASGCYTGCPISCGRVCKVESGPYETPEHEGGEYETMSVFTAYLLNDDCDAAVNAGYLCNKYGLDTISCGAVIAFAMDCYENKLLPEYDGEKLDLTWGNSSVIPEIIERIACRQGIGDLLALGVKKAAEKIGDRSSEYAIHVKGLEGPAHDPRSGKLLGLTYATANRGMCHIHPLEGMAFDRGKMSWGLCEYGATDPEVIDRWDEEGKGRDCKILQDGMILPDILSTCKFMMYAGLTLEHWAGMLSGMMGWEVSGRQLLLIGERISNLQRMFNVREGFSRSDDVLPERVLSLPEFGIYKDEARCVTNDFDKLLDEYYKARDWDPVTGIPTAEKAESLGLSFFKGEN